MKCPCCGDGDTSPTGKQTYAFEGVTLDLNLGLLEYGAQTVRLTKRLALMFHEIAQAWPGRCPRERLRLIIDETSTKEIDSKGNLAVHMSRLRSCIQDIGLGIETCSRQGAALNTHAGMRRSRSWTEEERLAMIEERNKGKTWSQVGKLFSIDAHSARGIANYAATRLGLPLLRERVIDPKRAKAWLQQESRRLKGGGS
jgi:DNA-binding winged helix-turn-helix (wHTH) protein